MKRRKPTQEKPTKRWTSLADKWVFWNKKRIKRRCDGRLHHRLSAPGRRRSGAVGSRPGALTLSSDLRELYTGQRIHGSGRLQRRTDSWLSRARTKMSRAAQDAIARSERRMSSRRQNNPKEATPSTTSLVLAANVKSPRPRVRSRKHGVGTLCATDSLDSDGHALQRGGVAGITRRRACCARTQGSCSQRTRAARSSVGATLPAS